MVFDEEERASTQPPTPLPAPTAETVFSSVVSLAQRVARIRSEVDALALVSSWELDGAGALALFDGVFELSDRMQAIAVRALPVVEAGVPWPMSPDTGGCHLSGFLTTAHSQGLLVALRAVHAADDDRTASKCRAGALSDLAPLTLDHGLTGKGASVRPHISVLIDYPTLMTLATTAGVAHQINPALLLHSPPVGGPLDPEVLNIGRAKRTFTGQSRRAIIARDKHCQFPRCTAPPRRCEGHHSQHWFRDQGDTDARSGALLCWQPRLRARQRDPDHLETRRRLAIHRPPRHHPAPLNLHR